MWRQSIFRIHTTSNRNPHAYTYLFKLICDWFYNIIFMSGTFINISVKPNDIFKRALIKRKLHVRQIKLIKLTYFK